MHNEHDRDRQSPSSSSERGRSDSRRRSRSREIGSGSESVRNSGDISRSGVGSDMDDMEMDDSDLAELQREGNLGNERNRNEPDSER